MNYSSIQNFESSNSIDKETVINICKYGTYYNPASNHYGSSKNVVCDKCYKNRLDICIGWKSYDLCFKCTEEINNELKNKMDFDMIRTNMEQNQFTSIKKINNDFLTYMMQNQFANDDRELTKMMQNQFSNNSEYKTKMMQNKFWKN